MKKLKKILLISMIIIATMLFLPKIVPELESAYVVEATSVKLNTTKTTIYEGNTYNLKVKGSNKKVKWSTSDKKIATVDQKGKVTAKKNGTATITAKVENRTLKCKVTVKLLQFDTKFYYLEEVAKEYRSCYKIKNYKDFKYDLDGDGKKDKITIRNMGIDDYDIQHYVLELNGKIFAVSGDDIENIGNVYIVDLNKNDKTLEVVVLDEGNNDYTSYQIYSKKGNKMKKIDTIFGHNMKINKKGKIVIDSFIADALLPKVYDKYYQYSNGKIRNKIINIKTLKNIEFRTDYDTYFTPSMKNLDNFLNTDLSDKDYMQELRKNKIYNNVFKGFYIEKFTENNEIYVKFKNKQKGYIFSAQGHLAG